MDIVKRVRQRTAARYLLQQQFIQDSHARDFYNLTADNNVADEFNRRCLQVQKQRIEREETLEDLQCQIERLKLEKDILQLQLQQAELAASINDAVARPECSSDGQGDGVMLYTLQQEYLTDALRVAQEQTDEHLREQTMCYTVSVDSTPLQRHTFTLEGDLPFKTQCQLQNLSYSGVFCIECRGTDSDKAAANADGDTQQ